MCSPLGIILTYTASHRYILEIFYPFCLVLSVSFYTGGKAALFARPHEIVIFIDLIILIGFNLFFFFSHCLRCPNRIVQALDFSSLITFWSFLFPEASSKSEGSPLQRPENLPKKQDEKNLARPTRPSVSTLSLSSHCFDQDCVKIVFFFFSLFNHRRNSTSHESLGTS